MDSGTPTLIAHPDKCHPKKVVSLALLNVQAGRGSAISNAQIPMLKFTHYSEQAGSHEPLEPRSPFTNANPSDLTKAFMAILDCECD